MNISIIGTGYVGLVTGVGLAKQRDNYVTCVDADAGKINMLNEYKSPIYERDIEENIKELCLAGKLKFTTELKYALEHSYAIFVAVGTPEKNNGSCDLSSVNRVVEDVVTWMNTQERPTERILVMKSTVIPGTCEDIVTYINANLNNKHKLDVVSNPEFLKEGVALHDFLYPDRIVIGSTSQHANTFVASCYGDIALSNKVVYCENTQTAELIKYASNAMLATRISFINEIASIARKIGAYMSTVKEGVGSDTRIGKAFLNPGCGYGGSCFPKDVNALMYLQEKLNLTSHVLFGTVGQNYESKLLPVEMLKAHYGQELKYKSVAIWGASFKPETDDIREAPCLSILNLLWNIGVTDIRVYDPKALPNLRRWIHDNLTLATPNIKLCDSKWEAVKDADALIICTEWQQCIEGVSIKLAELMRNSVIVDGRNCGLYIKNLLPCDTFKAYYHI